MMPRPMKPMMGCSLPVMKSLRLGPGRQRDVLRSDVVYLAINDDHVGEAFRLPTEDVPLPLRNVERQPRLERDGDGQGVGGRAVLNPGVPGVQYEDRLFCMLVGRHRPRIV